MNKLVIIMLAFVVLASAKDYKLHNQQDVLNARMECVEAKKVPAEHIEKYLKYQFPDDEVTRCYIQCILEKFQIFEAKTGFQTDNLIAQLEHGKENKDAVKADIEKCADKNDQNSDSCAWAYSGFKCFMAKNLPLVQEILESN